MKEGRKNRIPGGPSAPLLSRPKRILFGLIVLVLPCTLLAVLEFSLRLFSYGNDLDLVRPRNIRNREYFELNRKAAARYFAQAGTTIPEFHEDMFLKEKGTGIKRVFCLGESTMEGFPYEFNATAPSFLKDRLQALFPADTIEVINAGLSAVGSYVVADIMSQLLDYGPDLFVVYVGHNEFYGAFGAGSSVGTGSIPWLTRLGIRLLHYKTYLALRDAYVWLTGRSAGDGLPPLDATLMEQMVREPHIRLKSKIYQSTLLAYRDNLHALIDIARSGRVPVLFSTMVSNERDQAPFAGLFDEATTAASREEWSRLLNQAEIALNTGSNVRAIELCRDAIALDSGNAVGYFRLGRALEAEGRFAEARVSYLKAKDHDALRFRATEDVQRTLLDVCQERRVPVARADSSFAAASLHGIIGHGLILEHLHPNIRGYFLLAKTWAETIMDNQLLQPGGRSPHIIPDSLLFQRSMVSIFDEELGRIKTALLTRKWPFRTTPDTTFFGPRDSIAAIVFAYVRHDLFWSAARYELARYFARRGSFDLARRECLAVSRVIPYSYQPLLFVADYYRYEGKRDEAAQAYRRCIATEDNPYAHMKLGLLLLEAGSDSTGARELERGFALDGQEGMSMSAEAKATGRYFLGVAYARTGRVAEAKENLRFALTLNPSLKPAKDFLKSLQ